MAHTYSFNQNKPSLLVEDTEVMVNGLHLGIVQATVDRHIHTRMMFTPVFNGMSGPCFKSLLNSEDIHVLHLLASGLCERKAPCAFLALMHSLLSINPHHLSLTHSNKGN